MKAILLILSFMMGCATPSTPKVFTVMLDPGHDPANAGTVGVKGIAEVQYNDQFVAVLKQELESNSQIRVLLTRESDQNKSLAERVALANNSRADLYISIHHDSAQEQYLKKLGNSEKAGWATVRPIAGYSLFVSRDNPKFRESFEFAKKIASEFRNIQRKPTLHHAEKIKGEGRELLDSSRGIYRYDTLEVLQKTKIPAVLLEVGVIVDAKDEAYISDPATIRECARAVQSAVESFLKL